MLPSITDLIFICMLFALSFGTFSPRLLGDADIGWHIRNGELMLRSHALTRLDPFSSSMGGKTWYAWEWLYDLLVGVVHLWTGLNGVVLLTALIVALTFAFVWKLSLRRGALLLIEIPFFMLAFGAAAIHLFARPHVFTWLFAVIFFVVLDSAEQKVNRRFLWWLPALMVLWTNLHGGFVLGFVLLAIYLLSAVIDYAVKPLARLQTAGWLKQLGAISIISAAASLINPYGYKLQLHIYHYLTNRWFMNHIDEFLSPNLHQVSGECFVVLVLLALLALAVAKTKLPVSNWFVLLFAVYSGFYASRNLPVSSLLIMLIAAPVLSEAVFSSENASPRTAAQKMLNRAAAFSRRMENLEIRLRGHLWPVAAIVLGFVVVLSAGRLGSHELMNARFNPKRFPVQAAGFIAQQSIPGPVFCPDSWGGYLIYRLYPGTRVYLDDRHDLYGEAFFKNYLKIVHISPEWQKELNAADVPWVLVPKESSLANVLKEAPDWEPIYEDSVAVLFQKKSAVAIH